ncbi:phage/conjugal plasmid C-4 type zinc finger protein, TraR family [Canicola haemoglobinophilus]|uniref:Phage/conjugal plasmid C-4 type zinc finger protein, TraR family n=1 Tax=Canicola haemoglobinophilus TaxID=733 RepID=A0AB38H9U2_9PAST|nr:TraR/DksA C4-type zinc finger protein [Canicola haemoglobinophilus]STO55349.1 phage/conjugal plasmid C-4 type zinc finger protein, TraR family [Canicola haemoglobinophilus]STO69082.1 phage/conjugal plasmid C-4 type zinc finger protein, TraR family [Canicola haemoglobinophilus]
MSDIADITQEREERMMTDFLSKFRPQTSAAIIGRDCIDCCIEIPLARIKAVPYCTRCVHCQEIAEK